MASHPAQYWQSSDAAPLCTSCAWMGIAWPARFDEWLGADKCGAGTITGGRTQRKCFRYEGVRAELVTIESNPADTCDWQYRRVDGMTVRKPKSA